MSNTLPYYVEKARERARELLAEAYAAAVREAPATYSRRQIHARAAWHALQILEREAGLEDLE